MKKIYFFILLLLLLAAGIFSGTAAAALTSSTDDKIDYHQYHIGENCVINTKDCTYLTKMTFSKDLASFFKLGADIRITEDNVSFLDSHHLSLPKLISDDNRFITIPDETVVFGITFTVIGSDKKPLTLGHSGTFTFELPVNKTEELAVGWFWNGKWIDRTIHPLGNNRWQVEYDNTDGYYVILAIEKGTPNPFTGAAKSSAVISAENQMEDSSAENDSALNLTAADDNLSKTSDDTGGSPPLIIGIVAAVIVFSVVAAVSIRQKSARKMNKESKDKP